MKNRFDYAEAGGALLLGVNGVVMICHGLSNARAICNAVAAVHEMASKQIEERIHDELITSHFGQNNGSKNKSQDNRHGVLYAAASDDQR